MDTRSYEAIIVGGGIAGLQASIQLGRSLHTVLVVDRGGGRSALCRSYHNVLGYPNGVAGEELRRIGRGQAESVGVQFVQDDIVAAERLLGGRFAVTGRSGARYEADTLLIATGVTDHLPEITGLVPCLGRSVYICPDCDGYEVKGKKTIVLGTGAVGANMALTLHYFTDQLVYINHVPSGSPAKTIPFDKVRNLQERGIETITGTISGILTQGDGMFAGVRFSGGKELTGERGFIGFGGNEVNTELFSQLGAERMESKHVIADPRTKTTSVPGLFAAGDINVHSEQMTIAMGEGQQAAIWMHKSLLQRRQSKTKDNRELVSQK